MPTKTAPIPTALIKTKTEGMRLVTPLEAEVQSLQVTTEDEYTAADELLHGIQSAIRTWDAKMETILKPARETKQAADKLKAEVRVPLAQLELQVKQQMTEFKQREQRAIREAQQRAEAEAEELRRQIEETANREATARTKQMRERLAQQREVLEEKAEAIEAPPEAVKAAHSQTRTIKKWRFRDDGTEGEELSGIPNGFREFVEACANHHRETMCSAAIVPPLDCLLPNREYMDHLFRKDPQTFASWPGIDIYDDIIIAGRR